MRIVPRTSLACSGCRDDDNNVYVLDLLSDKWATLRRGVGHKDWVFTLSWVSENSFVTGGRDRSVMLWNPLNTEQYTMTPQAEYKVHDGKVCSSFVRPCRVHMQHLCMHGATVTCQCVLGGSSWLGWPRAHSAPSPAHSGLACSHLLRPGGRRLSWRIHGWSVPASHAEREPGPA